MIDTLSYPVVVLQKDKEQQWSPCYHNQSMQKLLESEADALSALVERYVQKGSKGSCTLHDVEMFGTLYTVHFNPNKELLFVLFIEIPLKDLFDNLTFHDLSGASSAIIVVLDNMGRVLDINDCFTELAGVDKETAAGQSFFEMFIPGDPDKLTYYFENILANDDHHQHFITPFKGQKGKIHRINWQVSKIVRLEQTYIIAVGSDISKFLEDNQNLKQQLTSIKIGFDYFPLATGYMNAEGIFTKMNQRFLKMFGLDETDKKVTFDNIAPFKKHIGFEKMNKYVELIKEMSYTIDNVSTKKPAKLKVDIRMLRGTKESSKFYIVVAQVLG